MSDIPKPEPGLESNPPTNDEEVKQNDQINLKVANQLGSEVFFKIKKSTPLKKLMESYASRQGIAMTSVRFLYDGQRLQPDSTPASLNMENNDSIDALLEQQGGSFSK